MSSTRSCCPPRSRVHTRLPRRIGEGGLCFLALLAFVAATGGFSQATAPVRTVPAVDLNRYVGDWFEIARLPNRFQTRCAGNVRASYALAAGGRLAVTNRCRGQNGEVIEANGAAKVVDTQSSARLKVRFAPAFLSFLPMVWGDYWILGLADDYSWAVVGSPDRKYLWILSRTPSMDPAQYGKAVAVATTNSFASDGLIKTSHSRTP
jgi:apolipoprotein D and lipocalin family protein